MLMVPLHQRRTLARDDPVLVGTDLSRPFGNWNVGGY